MVKQGRVLIVDDERFNINVLVELLRPDYVTMVAKNGKQALKLARSDTPPDLILLDIMMPGMDGYEVCRRLRQEPLTENIPIIFVTALDEVESEEKGLELGAVDYIVKPISPLLVKLRVKNHIRLKQQNDLLRNLATLDGLTGIPNRRRFDQYLEQEWQRSMRSGTFLSMVMMDIDFFKRYNDHYGHGAGDGCLRRVARALSGAVLRAVDLVARYGGEEFVCLLPDIDAGAAVVIGEKLRKAVADLGIPHEYSQAAAYVTISLGVATMIPRREETSLALLEQADQNLYRAKEQGRNRLCLSPAG